MKDLYKRLNLSRGATDDQIRTRCSSAPTDVRESTEAILLDPRRRRIYDRNHELLSTIAQLRLDLGLNYTRFWSRREFKDFWQAPTYIDPRPQTNARPTRRVDKMMIAQAFHAARTVHYHGRHHAARWGWLWALAFAIGVLIATLVVLWRLSY